MYFKVDEIRKVVDSELGFVADVPYIQSEAKVSSLEIMARNLSNSLLFIITSWECSRHQEFLGVLEGHNHQMTY